MSFGPRPTVKFGPTLTPMVKYLMMTCAGAFLLQWLGDNRAMIQIFGLTPYQVLSKLFLWRKIPMGGVWSTPAKWISLLVTL